MSAHPPQITVTSVLDDEQAAAVRDLAQRCHTVDDHHPLNEDGLLSLTRAGAATPLLLNDLLV
ncbi:MAG: hypothetical protein L0G99_18095, partial [Propionibacteriales bacterium]|nr:hypothetical protein [Propionibacteriales bacterium]